DRDVVPLWAAKFAIQFLALVGIARDQEDFAGLGTQLCAIGIEVHGPKGGSAATDWAVQFDIRCQLNRHGTRSFRVYSCVGAVQAPCRGCAHGSYQPPRTPR